MNVFLQKTNISWDWGFESLRGHARIEWLDAPLNNPQNTGEVNYVDLMNNDSVTR